jgi:hypothetical protein
MLMETGCWGIMNGMDEAPIMMFSEGISKLMGMLRVIIWGCTGRVSVHTSVRIYM